MGASNAVGGSHDGLPAMTSLERKVCKHLEGGRTISPRQLAADIRPVKDTGPRHDDVARAIRTLEQKGVIRLRRTAYRRVAKWKASRSGTGWLEEYSGGSEDMTDLEQAVYACLDDSKHMVLEQLVEEVQESGYVEFRDAAMLDTVHSLMNRGLAVIRNGECRLAANGKAGAQHAGHGKPKGAERGGRPDPEWLERAVHEILEDDRYRSFSHLEASVSLQNGAKATSNDIVDAVRSLEGKGLAEIMDMKFQREPDMKVLRRLEEGATAYDQRRGKSYRQDMTEAEYRVFMLLSGQPPISLETMRWMVKTSAGEGLAVADVEGAAHSLCRKGIIRVHGVACRRPEHGAGLGSNAKMPAG